VVVRGDGAPSASALLRVDGRAPPAAAGREHGGRVAHRAVVCAVARHLIEATCLLPRAARPQARTRCAGTSPSCGCRSRTGSCCVRDDIPDALPAQPAPLRAPAARHRPDVLAGDHRDAASIQGALASGERAARAVLVDAGV
jgi:hypothetical protein